MCQYIHKLFRENYSEFSKVAGNCQYGLWGLTVRSLIMIRVPSLLKISGSVWCLLAHFLNGFLVIFSVLKVQFANISKKLVQFGARKFQKIGSVAPGFATIKKLFKPRTEPKN